MNNLDIQYQNLLLDILENGTPKGDRTGTGTRSVFGRQIRHKMSEGFPLITTKKMYWKGIVTELLWFLRGDTNIKFLVENNCHIWNGDAYKKYHSTWEMDTWGVLESLSTEQFTERIKTDAEFAKQWGDLGPIYGKQWRKWGTGENVTIGHNGSHTLLGEKVIDQIANLIRDLKTNPDSRRLMVNAWNVGELDSMVLPPCHYGFQVYTRELTLDERQSHWANVLLKDRSYTDKMSHADLDTVYCPKRYISLMWNQRSVDTFLGLPFNIASYGLLLTIIAKLVNMIPDELVGNLGDVHLYENHLEQAREQIGRRLTHEERFKWWFDNCKPGRDTVDHYDTLSAAQQVMRLDASHVPLTSREPFPLPSLNINTEFWATESGECGIGPLDTDAFFDGLDNNVQHFVRCLIDEDIQLGNYKHHPHIAAPLNN